MNKKQKALIESAIPYPLGSPLTAVYIIPSGRLYKGTFKGNNFDHMILIGEDAFSGTYYYINEGCETDVMAMFHLSHVHSIDIPHRHGGAVRICFSPVVMFDTDLKEFSSAVPKEFRDPAVPSEEDQPISATKPEDDIDIKLSYFGN